MGACSWFLIEVSSTEDFEDSKGERIGVVCIIRSEEWRLPEVDSLVVGNKAASMFLSVFLTSFQEDVSALLSTRSFCVDPVARYEPPSHYPLLR